VLLVSSLSVGLPLQWNLLVERGSEGKNQGFQGIQDKYCGGGTIIGVKSETLASGNLIGHGKERKVGEENRKKRPYSSHGTFVVNPRSLHYSPIQVCLNKRSGIKKNAKGMEKAWT